MLCVSTPCFVRPWVGWSLVSPLFTFSASFSFLSSLLLPKRPSDLFFHYPCPTACDWGSRVSGLVSSASCNSALILRMLGKCICGSCQIWRSSREGKLFCYTVYFFNNYLKKFDILLQWYITPKRINYIQINTKNIFKKCFRLKIE